MLEAKVSAGAVLRLYPTVRDPDASIEQAEVLAVEPLKGGRAGRCLAGRSMGKAPIRLKEVVYTLSPFQQSVMSGLWKDMPHKAAHYASTVSGPHPSRGWLAVSPAGRLQ